jgi:hypothetical protein
MPPTASHPCGGCIPGDDSQARLATALAFRVACRYIDVKFSDLSREWGPRDPLFFVS